MPFYIKWIIIAIESYLLGSLSFSIIVSKNLYKQDIRTFGSGNAGMTNVLRTFGKKAAALTITGDVLKGTVAVLIARLLFMNSPVLLIHRYAFTLFGREIFFSNHLMMEIGLYIAVLGAVLGHMLCGNFIVTTNYYRYNTYRYYVSYKIIHYFTLPLLVAYIDNSTLIIIPHLHQLFNLFF
jgi:acyl-phosphate glycerol 3-phosphate acyltransferase